MRAFACLALLGALAACDDDGDRARAPGPVEMTAEAVSFYCQMNVLDHPGPKAQIHVAGMPAPLFFAQVRDAVAFLKSAERMGDVVAVYVTDMGPAGSWGHPGRGNWIAGGQAFYVVGSGRRAGMGAPELVPFADRAAARAFAAAEGGEVMGLDAIPDRAVLGPVEIAPPAPGDTPT